MVSPARVAVDSKAICWLGRLVMRDAMFDSLLDCSVTQAQAVVMLGLPGQYAM
ncbi:hypothetical protein HNP55_002601 [Paucibacter oligotrophus]|uniref:Uncharacterized protein n=1 Tax=Roseateles oligotrophus TaxID=1769250 RepID=A0A840LB64_9BURK|nr:hypothetical protein [Roseateles oligotrophus]